ncbi:MAG: hypothetical protein ACTSRG_13600 [Candidatus Helarchaeota archaeon]
MITVENLQIFGLTRNQAKVLYFFLQNRERRDLSYKKIREEIKSKKSFYREILQDLIEKKFLYVIKDNRPITYHFNATRFKEILQEKQNNYLKEKKDFDKILEKIKEVTDITEFLKSLQGQLRLTSDQLAILNTLLTKGNSPDQKILTLKQIGAYLKQENTTPTIRYNLALLERRGFVKQEKMGRTNYYRPENLKTIIEIEQKFQEKLWDEKKKSMHKIIQFFQEEHSKVTKKIKHFEVKDDFKKITKTIIQLVKNFEEYLILDFRCSFERTDLVIEFLDNIFENVQRIIGQKEDIYVRILMNIDDWIFHKLDFKFLQFIKQINAKKFEFRVPIKWEKREFRIIADDHWLFQIIGVYELSGNENGLLIDDKTTSSQAVLQFNQLWENSLDLRDAILDYSINKEFENAINESERSSPPKYNFTDKFIVITGFRKLIRFLLRIYQSAKTEILTITGPVFQSKDGDLSLLEDLKKERFYERLNEVIDSKARAGINFRWIRNITSPHLKIYKDDKSKEEFMNFILSKYPIVQQKQIKLEKYQFSIIDRRILLIFEYKKMAKLTINLDEFIIDKYLYIFNNTWSDSIDIRLQWLTEISEPLKKNICDSFNDYSLNIDLPKAGEIKKFDGRFFRPIMYFLLKHAKMEIYVVRTYSIDPIQGNKQFIPTILPYFKDFIKVIKDSNVKAKVILSYLPEFLKLITDKDIKGYFDRFPRAQVRFLPKEFQSNTFFGIFDNYLLSILGGTDKKNFHLVIMNGETIRNYYIEQFNTYWKNSVDMSLIYYEYASESIKKSTDNFFYKHKIKNIMDSEQIKDKFPLK